MGARVRKVGVHCTEMLFDVMGLQGNTQGESEDGDIDQEPSHRAVSIGGREEGETEDAAREAGGKQGWERSGKPSEHVFQERGGDPLSHMLLEGQVRQRLRSLY